MTQDAETVERHLPLTQAVFHILFALLDKERHGLGVMREVEERTKGAVRLGPGTLYGTLKRMRTAGLIDETPGDEKASGRLRFYRPTELGRLVAAAETRRLSALLEIANAKQGISATEGSA
jgi:DNA-binding PadR family transcriptional regulator